MWPGSEAPARGCHGLAREESCAAMVKGECPSQQRSETALLARATPAVPMLLDHMSTHVMSVIQPCSFMY